MEASGQMAEVVVIASSTRGFLVTDADAPSCDQTVINPPRPG
jgi:hypothetical protein